MILFCYRYVAFPIGQHYNLNEKQPTKALPNEILEKAYKKYGKHPPAYNTLVVSMCVVLSGLPVHSSFSLCACVCVYIYIYMCVCVCVCDICLLIGS